MIFAFMIYPGKLAWQTCLLAESIRTFAGNIANEPIWVLVPQSVESLLAETRANLEAQQVRLIPFALDEAVVNFPFAAKVVAAAAAESVAMAESNDQLVWMDTDSLVVQEPADLRLTTMKQVGYRPVDHTLIGLLWDAPLDAFWELVYERCGVLAKRPFPMTGSVDRKRIRPYFNAGMLVTRPGSQLLQNWCNQFLQNHQDPAFTPFYEQHVLYRIFMHQAILTGTILAQFEQSELQLLPHLVNYPLHMHATYPRSRRPALLNDVITTRYDELLQAPNWRELIDIAEPLQSWLVARVPG
ncbi:MAG: hypothetical protein DWQ04_13590 [Chloroflexi bacterium]|nr:MAG: hypothetical protein DWQ04_13590 [Chloroflexota bacterium]